MATFPNFSPTDHILFGAGDPVGAPIGDGYIYYNVNSPVTQWVAYNGVWIALGATTPTLPPSGWPRPVSMGGSAGITSTPTNYRTGGTNSLTPGTWSGYEFEGRLKWDAVSTGTWVFNNCLFSYDSIRQIEIAETCTNLDITFQNCTFDSNTQTISGEQLAYWGGAGCKLTIRDCVFGNTVSGDMIKFGANGASAGGVTLEDCYLYGCDWSTNAHADILQISGDSDYPITIKHNWFDCGPNSLDDTLEWANTCIFMGDPGFTTPPDDPLTSAPSNLILITENYFNRARQQFCMYKKVDRATPPGQEAYHSSNVQVTNNVFGPDFRWDQFISNYLDTYASGTDGSGFWEYYGYSSMDFVFTSNTEGDTEGVSTGTQIVKPSSKTGP